MFEPVHHTVSWHIMPLINTHTQTGWHLLRSWCILPFQSDQAFALMLSYLFQYGFLQRFHLRWWRRNLHTPVASWDVIAGFFVGVNVHTMTHLWPESSVFCQRARSALKLKPTCVVHIKAVLRCIGIFFQSHSWLYLLFLIYRLWNSGRLSMKKYPHSSNQDGRNLIHFGLIFTPIYIYKSTCLFIFSSLWVTCWYCTSLFSYSVPISSLI